MNTQSSQIIKYSGDGAAACPDAGEDKHHQLADRVEKKVQHH